MSSETKKVQINVKQAEKLLGEAITAFDEEDAKRAMEKVKTAEKARRQSLRRFTVALRALKKANETVEKAEEEGEIDLGRARHHLMNANAAFEDGDYSRVGEEARFAMGKCLGDPLLGRDIIIKTELEPEDEHHMRFTVKVGNLLKRTISEIPLAIVNLQPYLVNIDEGSDAVIKELGPGVVKSYKFRLELADDSSDMGQYYLGRDIALSSTLNYRHGKLVSSITVTNRSASTMVDLSVQPFLPQGYRSDKDVKEIDVLYPNESKTVVFSLHPEGEEDGTPYPAFPDEEETREVGYGGKEEEVPTLEEHGLFKEREEEGSLLEDGDSEFPDTEYDDELKDLENWSPSWKEELSKEEGGEGEDHSWDEDEDSYENEEDSEIDDNLSKPEGEGAVEDEFETPGGELKLPEEDRKTQEESEREEIKLPDEENDESLNEFPEEAGKSEKKKAKKRHRKNPKAGKGNKRPGKKNDKDGIVEIEE